MLLHVREWTLATGGFGSVNGPSEVLGIPVVCDGRVFAAIGTNPEDGGGVGCLNCIAVHYATDGAAVAEAVWRNTTVKRSMASVSAGGGLLFFADNQGLIYCLDPRTGVA